MDKRGNVKIWRDYRLGKWFLAGWSIHSFLIWLLSVLYRNALLHIINDLLDPKVLSQFFPLSTFLQCLTCDVPSLLEDDKHKVGNAGLGPLRELGLEIQICKSGSVDAVARGKGPLCWGAQMPRTVTEPCRVMALRGQGERWAGKQQSENRKGIRKLRERSQRMMWVLSDAFLLWVALGVARAEGVSPYLQRG